MTETATKTRKAPAETRREDTPDGWLDMADAPKNGKPLRLMSPDHQVVEAHWRITREVRKEPLGWHEKGLWGLWGAPGVHVPFEPIAWRPMYA